VLLHVLVQCRNNLQQEIIAIHVNHGLNSNAGQWAEHCQAICDSLNIKLIQIQIDATAPRGESQEEWARNLRYDAIKKEIIKDDLFLTAHHQDDLAETLLLQLFRGAGPAGLSAMPVKTELGPGWHIRPFLGSCREDLAAYADAAGLKWIDDDSNSNERFDRNYLRHRVMPVIRDRWPGILNTLSRASGIQSEVNRLIEDLAAFDLNTCINTENYSLKQKCLGSLPVHRAINVVRYWLKIQQHRSPGARILQQIMIDVVNSEHNASPCISWDDIEIRRYRDMIFLTRNLPHISDVKRKITWDINDNCLLEYGRLSADKNIGSGIAYEKITGREISVRYRNGQEQIKQGGHHHSLKNVFQKYGIPPCFRKIIPLIYIDDTLVEIAGLYIDEDFITTPGKEALRVTWDRANEIYSMKYIN
jgi:tRNA(Ile)-lysidine synthase